MPLLLAASPVLSIVGAVMVVSVFVLFTVAILRQTRSQQGPGTIEPEPEDMSRRERARAAHGRRAGWHAMLHRATRER